VRNESGRNPGLEAVIVLLTAFNFCRLTSSLANRDFQEKVMLIIDITFFVGKIYTHA
jgi:hypothetical protein